MQTMIKALKTCDLLHLQALGECSTKTFFLSLFYLFICLYLFLIKSTGVLDGFLDYKDLE